MKQVDGQYPVVRTGRDGRHVFRPDSHTLVQLGEVNGDESRHHLRAQDAQAARHTRVAAREGHLHEDADGQREAAAAADRAVYGAGPRRNRRLVNVVRAQTRRRHAALRRVVRVARAERVRRRHGRAVHRRGRVRTGGRAHRADAARSAHSEARRTRCRGGRAAIS